jgi:hypothetical protein
MKSAGVGLGMLMATAGVCVAAVPPSIASEVVRGVAAAGARDSAAPALRGENAGTPSAGFSAGATLAAWRNASAGLAHDVAYPLGDGGEAATVRNDCFDEKTAFAALEAARARLGATPEDLVSAAGLTVDAVAAWIARRAAAPAACR